MRHLLLFLIIVAAALQGCTTTVDGTYIARSYVKERWLNVLREDAQKQDIISILGDPTSSYYNGNLLAYRLVLMVDKGVSEKSCKNYYHVTEPQFVNLRRKQIPEKGELVVIRQEMTAGWRVLCSEAEYHLLIVFRDDGRLAQYSFLEIFPR
jgi:hypothetical protein